MGRALAYCASSPHMPAMEGYLTIPPDRGTILGRALWKVSQDNLFRSCSSVSNNAEEKLRLDMWSLEIPNGPPHHTTEIGLRAQEMLVLGVSRKSPLL